MKTTRIRRNAASRMDWDEMHRRLDQVRSAIEPLDQLDPARQEQVLRERAVSLAKPFAAAKSAAADEHSIEVLEFKSAGERYAFETSYVAQVYPMCAITHIPGVPNFVVGIVAIQGEVLSVLDLRSLLDLPISRLLEPTSIIVLKGDAMEFGILAEEISGIERYPKNSIECGLSSLANIQQTYLKGVTSGRTAILDAVQLLSDPRLVVELG